MNRIWAALPLLAGLCSPALAQEIQTRDHSVTVTSTVPVLAGKKSKLYLRERGLPGVLKNGAGDKVVLFVHGAGTPAEVSFDVPYQDYKRWMGYLAKAGYDVFTVDMTGYGPRSASARRHERQMQSVGRAAKRLRGQLCANLSGRLDQYRKSDWNRYFRGGGFHPQAAPCGAG